MDEPETRLCAYCSTQKPWIFSGRKLKDGTKLFVNDEGRRWAGRRCPECERTRVQNALRWDKFERRLIAEKLEQEGYDILDASVPLKVARDGQVQTVGVRHAAVRGTQLTLEPCKDPCDLQVLVFASVRLCSPSQMASIEPSSIISEH